MSDSLAPAAWYPDPYGSTSLRWFDGHAWTELLQAPTDLSPDPTGPPSAADQGEGALITDWSSIFWLRKSFLGPCPVGALSLVGGRLNFTTKKNVVFDFPAADATYSVGAATSASPLIIHSSAGKFVLLGYYAHGFSPNATLLALVEQVRTGAAEQLRARQHAADAHTVTSLTAGVAAAVALGLPGLMVGSSLRGIADEYTVGPQEVRAFCRVLVNNALSVDTSALR